MENHQCASEHHVQLFDSSKSMAETVAAFLLAGFRRGERLLIVPAAKHLELLSRKLSDAGINIQEQIAADRLVILDADKTLPSLMKRDRVDPQAFEALAASLVTRLSDGGRVCIWGEMVDLLAERGNYRAALQLEELWTDLGRRVPYTMLCSYTAGHFGNPKTTTALADICAAHSHIDRKRDDLLAEFLLEQRVVPPAATRTDL